MNNNEPRLINKLLWNFPWLVRYPFARLRHLLSAKPVRPKHLIFTIANHFEPAWSDNGWLGIDEQKRKLDKYCGLARETGESLRDVDGTKFRHTNFYPAEQYEHGILETLAGMQAEGLGEVEIHLHHGVNEPDNSANTRRILTEFRDELAETHKCLSRFDGVGEPKYAFVHGNLALANSANGENCGVDDEMQILKETGCYVDMTLPSAPNITQVPMVNQIYECGLPLNQHTPHRTGKSVSVNDEDLKLPLIFTGPLMLNWTRRVRGMLVPRLDDGALVSSQPMDLQRLDRWVSANITVQGRPDWIFIKLYCHGFFNHDQSACIGEDVRRFFRTILDNGDKTGDYKVYFATAREAFNMVAAAVAGKTGAPGQYRNYRLRTIMDETPGRFEKNGPGTVES